MRESRPLVSVVTPSFNYGSFLGRCLESVRVQTYPSIEHIVLDAGSTDDSGTIIESYQGRYQMRSFIERDAGQADALNKGFAMAQGDVLCWLNADDYWLHERVVDEATQLLAGGADVVTAGGCHVDPAGRRIAAVAPPRLFPRLGPISEQLRYHDPILQPATFWRRDVHRPLRAHLNYTLDWRLFLDIAAGGATFAVVDTEWAAYRLHGTNKSTDDSARRRGEIAAILREEWGWWSFPHLWAWWVFWGYRLAEALNLSELKSGVRLANDSMARLTRGRVFSS